jgi:hypothetical protein
MGDTVTVCLTLNAATVTAQADIVWVIDNTASMGITINSIKSNLSTFTSQLASQGIDYRQGLVTFQDPLTEDLANGGFADTIAAYGWASSDAQFLSWVSGILCVGGGDLPEAGLEGLEAGDALGWRPGASRTMIIVTDISVHCLEEPVLPTLLPGQVLQSITFTASTLAGQGVVVDDIGSDLSADPYYGAGSPQKIAAITGGSWLNINTSDWSGLLSRLGRAIGSYTHVVITDPLPAELAPVAGTYSPATLTGNTLEWDLSTLSYGSSYQACFSAVVTSAYNGWISNTGYASADGVSQTGSNLAKVFYPSPSCTSTMSPTLTITPTATPSQTRTATPTVTCTPTASSTRTITPSATPTATPSCSATITPSSTATPWPMILHLFPASPNPFGGEGVWLTYFLSVDARVEVRVWDVSGEAVRDLDPVWGHAGDNELFWDGRNRAGRPVASGVYIYRLSATSRRDEKAFDFGKCAALR